MHCVILAYTCTKQQKRDKYSRGLQGNTLSNVLCWEGGDRGLTIQRKRVNGPLLRERKAEWLFMATDLPRENIFGPKIYLPFLSSASWVSMASKSIYLIYMHYKSHTHLLQPVNLSVNMTLSFCLYSYFVCNTLTCIMLSVLITLCFYCMSFMFAP